MTSVPINTYLTAEEASVVEEAQRTKTPVTDGLLAIIQRLEDGIFQSQHDGYPFPIPTWTPSEAEPPLSDKDALDYLASMALADQASSSGYVIDAARRTVLRTGRQIIAVTGD